MKLTPAERRWREAMQDIRLHQGWANHYARSGRPEKAEESLDKVIVLCNEAKVLASEIVKERT